MASKRQAGERRRRRKEALERPQYGWIWKPLLAALILYLLVVLGLGFWWSRTPALDVTQADGPAADAGTSADVVTGVATVDGLSGLVGTLLDKPGGYLRNDLAPPGLWLDNMPAWELGVLDQARWLSQALPALAGSDASALDATRKALEGDADDWFYPSTEHRLEQARVSLDGYRQALAGGQVAFAGDAQGLAAWLNGVARGLDDMGRRLSASVGSPEALVGLDLDTAGLPQETPWYRVDDVFFEARGETWALHRLLEAVGRDEAARIEAAGLETSWAALTAELELSQRRLWSPVVLNGSGFGLFANHSLVMAHHVMRARDLGRELSEGLAAQVGAPEAPAAEPDASASSGEDEASASPEEAAEALGAEGAGESAEESDGENGGEASEAPGDDAEALAVPEAGDAH
ncbi:DUF2333 family protein [Halomonas getboli]|uniref:DUF2333 family protein n=1 Tax=Halomonas getboli TaxID=2935862 RepID=UPI001FFE5A27|nr:DUF2333 family protein [Halomonas getboli]MCK2183472.1 DUF2333 family protein [Halomonas getboli]